VSVDFDEVRASGLSRHFGRRRALGHVTFSCRAGEVLGLLGPNGAGKSTLLAIVSTLLRPSAGALHFGVHAAATAGAPLRQRLGWLGHDLQLYPELTARENLTFFARLQGVGDVAAKVDQALSDARLESRADDVVSGFSRGMRQRLALERALLHRPRLLLLDEPFTGLDGPSTTALAARLSRLAGEGHLVMLATHDIDLADDVLTRALILREGRLVDDIGGRGWRQAYRASLSRES